MSQNTFYTTLNLSLREDF